MQARAANRLFVSRRVMIYKLQDMLAEAIEYGLVSPGVLACGARRDRDWKGEFVQYYCIAKGVALL